MDEELMDVLFPTLLACCTLHEANTERLQQVVNCSMLVEYLEEATQQSQNGRTTSPSSRLLPP